MVSAVAWVGSLAWELAHAVGVAKKKKKNVRTPFAFQKAQQETRCPQSTSYVCTPGTHVCLVASTPGQVPEYLCDQLERSFLNTTSSDWVWG